MVELLMLEKRTTSADEQQDHVALRGRDACGTATRIMRIAVPQALCVLREHLPAKTQKRQNLPF